LSFEGVGKIADAVLFEGYMLYPYRPSALKNRQRWNFGTLYPRDFALAQRPEEAWSFHAETLFEAGERSRISLRIRFLELVPDSTQRDTEWNRGIIRNWTVQAVSVGALCKGIQRELTAAELESEQISGPECGAGNHPLRARIEVAVDKIAERAYRLSATVSNITPVSEADKASRLRAQSSAFTSAHLLLHLENGVFVSILDPPGELAAAACACHNRGVFPVLAGEPGARSHVLCSPVILYDYPQIAPESAGEFFDATEIDEMLALRVLTLSDEEKQEMRAADPRAARILERTEALPQEHLLKLHGALRGMNRGRPESGEPAHAFQPWDPFARKPELDAVRVFGLELRKGDRVRLWPQKRADIMDMAMEGRTAVIEAVEQDLDDHVQLAVVLDDDPGKDMGLLRQPGHRFFFTPDEVEPLPARAP